MAPASDAEDEQVVFKWMYGDVINSPKFSKFAGAMNPMRWSGKAPHDVLIGQLVAANPAHSDGDRMSRPIRVAWRASRGSSGRGVFACASYSELRLELAKIRGHEARIAERNSVFQSDTDGSGFQSEATGFQSELKGVGEYLVPESFDRDTNKAEEHRSSSAGAHSWILNR